MYYLGLGVPIDYKKAMGYYLQSSNQGDEVATFNMGIFFLALFEQLTKNYKEIFITMEMENQ